MFKNAIHHAVLIMIVICDPKIHTLRVSAIQELIWTMWLNYLVNHIHRIIFSNISQVDSFNVQIDFHTCFQPKIDSYFFSGQIIWWIPFTAKLSSKSHIYRIIFRNILNIQIDFHTHLKLKICSYFLSSQIMC